MNIRDERKIFDKKGKIYESAILTFHGVDGFDVYNCSIPFQWEGKEYLYGRVEKRDEWARSWVRLFERIGPDEYSLTQTDPMIYQLEDPYIQILGKEMVMGGTHVRKTNNETVDTFYGYFFRGTQLDDMHYFTTGPDYMKDIRLCPMPDGSIGVFSRPRNAEVEAKYGSGAVVGFTTIKELGQLTAQVIADAPAIGALFGRGEWGGCNQCYPLKDGKIGVIGHKCYSEPSENGVTLAVYLNVAFVFDPATHTATEPRVIATRQSYPAFPAKKPELIDCAFTSGIVRRTDGKVDLYSGIGDSAEGRVVIDDPFADLW
ncbi:MAG: DUF1861 family protein [Eubacteriales bacterium]|nr:DUF1861 family protein [Eubacteriales bacterium]